MYSALLLKISVWLLILNRLLRRIFRRISIHKSSEKVKIPRLCLIRVFIKGIIALCYPFRLSYEDYFGTRSLINHVTISQTSFVARLASLSNTLWL